MRVVAWVYCSDDRVECGKQDAHHAVSLLLTSLSEGEKIVDVDVYFTNGFLVEDDVAAGRRNGCLDACI